MKKTTITKYECTDGRAFDQEMPAREHEIMLQIQSLQSDDTKRLTAVEMVRLMAAHPEVFSRLFSMIEDADCDGRQSLMFESVRGQPDADDPE